MIIIIVQCVFIHMCPVLFLSCLYICVCLYLKMQFPLQECYYSAWSGVCGPPCYCAPLVCVPAVIGVLAVWRHYKPKIKNQQPVDPLIKIWNEQDTKFPIFVGRRPFFTKLTLECGERPRGGHKGGIPRSRNLALGGANWYWCV